MAGPDEAQKGHARRSDVGDDVPNGRKFFTVRPGGFGEGRDGVSFCRIEEKKHKRRKEGRVEERGRGGRKRSWRVEKRGKKEKGRDFYPTKKGNFCCARAISGRNHSGTGAFVRMAGGLRGIDGSKGRMYQKDGKTSREECKKEDGMT